MAHYTSEQRLDDTQRLTHIGSWEWDVAKDEVTWSDELYRIYGIPIGTDIDFNTFLSLLHPDDRDKVNAVVADAMEKKSDYVVRHRIVLPSGEIRHLEGRGGVVIDSDGNVKLLYGTGHDITSEVEHNIELEKSLREKDMLLQELHHRVKNNLQIIASILNIQANGEKPVRDALLESRDRVHAIALAHELLYQSEDSGGFNFTTFIDYLLNSIIQVYDVEHRVFVKREFPNIRLAAAPAAHIGLLVNEIIINSYKHAFANLDEPQLIVQFNVVNNTDLRMYICDNGTKSTTLSNTNANSLGMQLITSLLQQLKANVNVKELNKYDVVIPDCVLVEDLS